LTYKIDKYLQLKNDLLVRSRKIDFLKRNNITEYKFTKLGKKETMSLLEEERNKIRNEMEFHLKMINDENKDDGLFSGVVFATFNSQEEIENFTRNFSKSMLKRFFTRIYHCLLQSLCRCFLTDARRNIIEKYRLTVEDAPEPDDIIWENLQYTSSEKILIALLIYFFSIILIAISFGLIIGLSYVQIIYKKSDERINVFLSIAISAIINIINGIFTITLNKLSE
jgi:hypothetical protein